MTHASAANKEMCAAGRCCQPAEVDVVYQIIRDDVPDVWATLGYCLDHSMEDE